MWNKELRPCIIFYILLLLCLNKNPFCYSMYMNIDNQTRLLSYVKSTFVMKDIYVEQLASF